MPPTDAQRREEFVHPTAQHAKKRGPTPFMIEPIKAFYVFLIANFIAALFAPIQDCDETFNYWEPTHYLSHGYGLQTWEYSPDYSIRSWSYIALHAIVGNIRRLLPQSTKVSEFYFIRYILAFVCSLCQVLLFRVVSFTLNPRIGLFFLMATVMSPGNFHASTAYLPSSFAMYTTLLGTAAFMNWRGGIKTSWGIWWFAVGGILGWPFASALCAPFLIEEGIFAVVALLRDRQRFYEAVVRVSRGVIAALLLLAGDTAINTFFYKKVEVVSWNIVKYNIFSSTGGPNLYGTEPWTFYFRNLTINFNMWFILALLSLPLFLIQKAFSAKQHGFQSGIRTVVFLSPFYMWLGIFTIQPHKEERFMYPMYPFVALNAAIGFHILLSGFGNSDPKTLIGKIPARLKLLTVVGVLFLSLNIGIARILGVFLAYSAPLKLYQPLGAGVFGQQGLGGRGDHVCFGKEWYRFPSSYFLPRDMHAKFIRSEFRGLLPGEFSEARTGFGFWSGTWLPTKGMNDRNEEDMSKYVDIRQCSFLVDTQYPENHDPLPPNEPDYIADEENWEIVKCEPFLDAGRTHLVARVLWVPDWSFVPEKFRRKWGQHCLLQRKG
ncbi:glycosyltransferase family 22 protein [Annulohypoxylon truncatum]|uniref:glycosyltransferase family 22 protein n=1 Tax=Annulohypoxylon truncatum TaxID=327061 RepID=UPI0020081A2D|nr:glycosyltransferase family 22 protein [Annulohypoxylon truncatum]KAI1209582.1 glycosyltransferase family 22 protein [Annulohypoxylon truncatum]